MAKEDLLWKHYNLHIDLYRSYLELALKMNVFYYAITGAILSYYFTHITEALVKWSLVLPFLMSLTFGAFLIIGAILSDDARKEIEETGVKLGFKVVPETKILKYLLCIFGGLMMIVSFGLGYLFFCYH